MLKKVLITDKAHTVLIDSLKGSGYHVDYHTSITLEELGEVIHHYTGLIINSKIILDKGLIDKAIQLKFVGRLGSGMEIVNVPYAKRKGIFVCSAPEGNRDAVAEHAVGMLLNLCNNIIAADKEVRSFDWNREKNRGVELMGKTLGIIGFGNTGKALGRRLSTWGMRILYHDIANFGVNCFERQDKLEHIKNADIISLHLPLTDDTYHYVDQEFLSLCKRGVIILNTSRGKVINTSDVIMGLKSGIIGGLAMDVFENEKPDTMTSEEKSMYTELFLLPNTIFSPHVAGWTTESLEKISLYILRKLRLAGFLS